MKKSLSLFLLLTILVGTTFSLSGCDFSRKDKKDSKDKKTETEEEDEEVLEVNKENVEGLWFDAHGPFMKVDLDKNELTMIREATYEIKEFNESGFRCVEKIDDTDYHGFFNGDYYPLFAYNEFKIPISFKENGHMDFMGYDIFRPDSEAGKAVNEKLEKVLFEDRFCSSNDPADGMNFTFDKDSLTYEYFSIKTDMDSLYENGIFTVHDEYSTKTIWAFLLDEKDEDVMIEYYGTICSNCSMDDTVEYLLAAEPMNFDPSRGEVIKLALDDDDVITKDLDDNILSTEPITERWDGYLTVNNKDLLMVLSGYTVIQSDVYDYGSMTATNKTVYEPWSMAGIALSYRQEVLDGKRENEIFTNNLIDIPLYDGDTMQIEIDLGEKDIKDVWLPDLANFSSYSEDYYSITDYSDNGSQLTDSLNVNHMTTDKIKVTVTFSTDCPAEYISVVRSGEGPIDADATLTELGNNKYSMTFTITSPGTFMVSDTRMANANNTEFTAEVLTEMDPALGYWALTQETGDIIDLVDLDYLKESVFDYETGSADFWVSTPEQLATVVYYVNSLSVFDGDEVKNMIYVHLMNDIDISEYDWVSMGYDNFAEAAGKSCEYCFRGVIFGNGYSIKGMKLVGGKNAFIGACHLTTIIGLTLENPVFEDDSYYEMLALIADDQCITEVFDCHVICDGADYFEFSATGNDSINYFDCSMVIDGEDMPLDKEDYKSFYYNGVDNWIRKYYQGDGSDYKYDAESEYKDFLENRDAFDHMFYYYGGKEEAERHVGYLDFNGWMVNGKFYLNFGYVYEE